MEQAAKKVISLVGERSNRTIGTDELNICEFPLTSSGRATSKHKNTLVFEDDIFDEGSRQSVHRKLMVSASEAFGLPTPADSDVLLVLMHLSNLKNGFTDRTVRFTRYELVKALGYDQSGASYRRIEQSLARWVNITLNYNRAWWNRDCRLWQNKSFHILESVDLRGRGDSSDDGTSSFTWNQVIFDSFQANQIKRLDLDTYFCLKTPTAKQAYRFLDKRFYRTKCLEFNLRTFACEHVGLSRSYDNGQLKRKLQPAIEELEAIQFLQALSPNDRYVKRQRGEWLIRLIRESRVADLATPIEIEQLKPLESALTARGLHGSTARELVGEFSEERIREKISMLDWYIAKGGEKCPKNPAGFLAAAIRDDYRPPSDYRIVAPAKERRPVKRLAIALAATEFSAEQKKLDDARIFFQSLPLDQQSRIEDLAVENGKRFRVDTYHRLKPAGGPLFDDILNMLIADLLQAMPELARPKAANSGI